MDRRLFACLALALGVLLSLARTSASAEAGMRCGSKLVGEGDSTYHVRRLCGDPAEARQRIEVRSLRVGSHQREPGGRWVVAERTVEVPVDEWIYDFGPHRFMRYLRFEHGRLVHVETGSYGFPR